MKPGSNAIICYSALIVCVSLFCYVNTLFPSVYWLDSGELQAAVPTFGIPHSPSFPSYLLVSHGISWIPLGDIAYRINLATALAATIVGVLTFFLALQLFGSMTPLDRFSSFFTACLVTLNPQVWFQSIKAEVYSLNTVWLMGILICAMGILGNPDDRKKVFRFACVAALFLGLGLTNHSLLTVHIFPALIILGFFCVRKLRPREILVAGQILIMMLSIYLYLPLRSIRDPMIDIGNPENYLNFVNAVTRKGSFNRFFGNVISEWIVNWSEYFNLIRENFSAGFLAIACIGLVFMFLRNTKQMTFLFVAAITNLSVTLMNRNFNMNPDTGPAYLMLSTIIFIICVGASIRVLLMGLGRTVQSRMIVRVVAIALSVIPMVWILEGFQSMGDHEDSSAGQVGRAIMDTCPEDSVLFFGMYYNLPFVVSYLQTVEKYRTDIVAISRSEVVYWSGGLENVAKRYPGLTAGVFAGEYGDLLTYLAPRGARNSDKVSYEQARMLLFNAMAWIAQEQSEFRDVFWISSEDDHLIKNDVEAYGPLLRLGSSLPLVSGSSTDPSMTIARRVLLREKLKFSMTRGAQVLAAFYDQQCVTLTARNELQQAVAARVWRINYDPRLAGFCD